jgi:alpha-mannosidase
MNVYLKENPSDFKQIKTLVDAGKIELFGGFCIPDLNMISGESIVQNLLIGRSYYQKTFGIKPEIASMVDAFGMCGQLPQILTKCGYKYLIAGRMPNKPSDIPSDGPFQWYGLDDTAITVTNATATINHLGYTCNTPKMYQETNQLGRSIGALKCIQGDVLAFYVTEEECIKDDLFWIIEAANRCSGRLVEFGKTQDYFETLNSAALPAYSGEFNPVFSGCYTTRISIKQMIRKAVNSLFAAEFINAVTNENTDFTPL